MKARPSELVNFVDRADMRVIQGRGGFGFPLEAAESLRVVGKIVWKKLQGNVWRPSFMSSAW
jgi:hypothetical protein